MSGLFGNHIVGFRTRRLIFTSISFAFVIFQKRYVLSHSSLSLNTSTVFLCIILFAKSRTLYDYDEGEIN